MADIPAQAVHSTDSVALRQDSAERLRRIVVQVGE